jgi:hypothetical protein
MVEEELERIVRDLERTNEVTRHLLKGYVAHSKMLIELVDELSKRVEKLERVKDLVGLN